MNVPQKTFKNENNNKKETRLFKTFLKHEKTISKENLDKIDENKKKKMKMMTGI